MLILTRIPGEEIRIGDDIVIKICGVDRNKVRVGIEAPKDIEVHRQEVYEKVRAEKEEIEVGDYELLIEKVNQIKELRLPDPDPRNCLDSEVVGTGYGVRMLLTCEGNYWILSTSIGTHTKDAYTPIKNTEWPKPLRKFASEIALVVLTQFNVKPGTKKVSKGETIIAFHFEEAEVH